MDLDTVNVAGGRRRSSASRRRSPRGASALLWSWVLLCIAVVGTMLALGGLHPPVLVVAALVVLLSTALAVASRDDSMRVPMPARLMFGLAGFTVLQTLPLPMSWVAYLSPVAGEVWLRASELTGASARFATVTLDPGASLLEIVKWSMYGCAFVAAARFGAARNMARATLLPFGSAVLLALVTLGHGLARATSVYGLYTPSFGPSPWHIGPILNPNHLAGYLNLGLFCGLGLFVSARAIVPRWLVGVGAAIIIPNAIVAGSRGGVLGLAVGLVSFIFLLPRSRRADPHFGPVPRSTALLGLVGVLTAAAVFTMLLVSDVTSRELFGTNVDKLRLLRSTTPILWDFKLTGAGRGAFDGIFAAYRSRENNGIYTHPENIIVQWVAEWGLGVGLLGLLGLAWTLRPRRLGQRWSAVAAGVSAGLLALIAQNLVDFSLELPAVALSATVAAGACWGHARGGSGSNPDGPFERFLRGRRGLLLVAAAVVGIAWAGIRGAHPVALERLHIAEQYEVVAGADRTALHDLREQVLVALARHPAEPYFYRIGALLTRRMGEDAWPWITRALERGPAAGRTHLLVSDLLADKGAKSQALLEMRYATLFDPALARETARRALALTHDYESLLRAVPQSAEGADALVAMAGGLPGSNDQEVRERLLRAALEHDPDSVPALRRFAGELVAQLEVGERGSRCTGERLAKCSEEASRSLDRLATLAPQAVEPVLLKSRLLVALGKPPDAARLLAEQCGRFSGKPRATCLGTRLELNARHGLSSDFAEAARAYLAENCAGADACAAALERLGDFSRQRGESLEAMSFYDRACHEAPTDSRSWKLAEAAWKSGMLAKTSVALARIRNKSQFEPRYSTLTAALSKSALEQASPPPAPPPGP